MFQNFTVDTQPKYLPQTDFRQINFSVEQGPNREVIVAQLVRKFLFSYGIGQFITTSQLRTAYRGRTEFATANNKIVFF